MPRFVVRKSVVENLFLRLTYKNQMNIGWTDNVNSASHYPSKYAAKNNLKFLTANFEMPSSIIVEEMKGN